MTRTSLQVPVEYLPTTADRIPCFLPVLTEFIRKNITSEGIFRKNGNKEKIKRLNISLSQHVPKIPDDADIDDVAGFLKTWLFKLPVPLIPENVYNQSYEPNNVDSVQTLIERLPLVNRRCLAVLLSIFKAVIDNSNINKMTMSNLAICVVPCLTHNSNAYTVPFQFETIYNRCIQCLNKEGNDFEFNAPDLCPRLNNYIPRARLQSRRIHDWKRQNIQYYSREELESISTTTENT